MDGGSPIEAVIVNVARSALPWETVDMELRLG